MKSLTIAYITAREKPAFEWFCDSINKQAVEGDLVDVIRVDGFRGSNLTHSPRPDTFPTYRQISPKPTIWQGKYRITKEDWWANSNARNTAICLCKTEWIAFLDDRCVLLPGYLNAIKNAMKDGYALAGAYEKRTGITVENGVIKHAGIVTGIDSRETYLTEQKIEPPFTCPGSWFFGCNFALPLEWALQIGGFEELMDGMSFEDVIFGRMLENNGFALKYDPRCKIIEDRTVGECGPTMRREDRGELGTPRDKSHKSLELFATQKQTQHEWDIRAVRNHVLQGNPFPIPSKKGYRDWFDGQLISEL